VQKLSIIGLTVWAIFFFLRITTGQVVFLYLALATIVVQVVLAGILRHRR
jgi:hypothetical protein